MARPKIGRNRGQYRITPSMVACVLQLAARNAAAAPVTRTRPAAQPKRRKSIKTTILAGSGAKVARSTEEMGALAEVSAPLASPAVSGPSVGSNPTPAKPITQQIRALIGEVLGDVPVRVVSVPAPRKPRVKPAVAEELEITPGKVREIITGAPGYGSGFDLVAARKAQFCDQCQRLRQPGEVTSCKSRWCSLKRTENSRG